MLNAPAIRERAAALKEHSSPCILCAHQCAAYRDRGDRGKCGIGQELLLASSGLHYGEESVLVGRGGSGTLFFSGCNLACVYCQNHDISQQPYGKRLSEQQLAHNMLDLQARGAENINLVTPSHQIAPIVSSLALARTQGLSLPIVYNCGGYESLETLQLLEGVVDIYMPDVKYFDNTKAQKYSGAGRYREVIQAALREMQRQVGDLQLDNRGTAQRGLLIRHLVLPHNLADSSEVLHFIANHISSAAWINVMDQYRPCYQARAYPDLKRHVLLSEVDRVREQARKLGLTRGLEG